MDYIIIIIIQWDPKWGKSYIQVGFMTLGWALKDGD